MPTGNELIDAFDPILKLTAGIPCDYWMDRQAKQHSCLAVAEVHYGPDDPKNLRKVLACCSGCRAHWFVQVARNAVFEHLRTR